MGYNVYDVLRNVVIYYTRKHNFFKINLWLWFDIVIIFKDETLNLLGINIVSKIHIYSKIIFKKHVMYLDNYNHSLYNLQNNFSKIHLYDNFFFGQKNMYFF
jgi:hypothetical protein